MEVRILKGSPNFGSVIMLDDGAGGAVSRALSATDAGGFLEGDLTCRSDASVDTAIEEAQCPDILHHLADIHATAAENALAAIDCDGAR
jgi:hypothetical protein